MTVGRWALTVIMMAAILGLGLSAPDPDASARLTKSTSVVLDPHDRTVAEVVKSIERRSGKRVIAQNPMTKGIVGGGQLGNPNDTTWFDRPVRLESPGPIPFWDAIDRLAETGRLAYRVADFGDSGAASTGVVFEGDGDVPSPACYVGPFRIGLDGVHEHRDVILVRGPWVQFYASGYPAPAVAADLASMPKDGGPLYAELNLAGEPGLICRRDGPLKAMVAVDEADRSLLAPAREDAWQLLRPLSTVAGNMTPIIRIPLRRVEGSNASKLLKRLRGVIPVEVAALKPEPAIVIPLGGSEGKTFRGGGAVFVVETDRTEPDRRRKLALSGRLSEEDSPLNDVRLTLLRTYQIRVADARGQAIHHFASSSSGGKDNSRNTLFFSYEYNPAQQLSEPPAEFRYYDLDRAAFQVPFEFHDIPLP